MKKLLIIMFFLSIYGNANSDTSLNAINEIGLVIEKMDNDSCDMQSSELETSIKYILSNSRIKFQNKHIRGKPYLYVVPVILHDKKNNICAGHINLSIKIMLQEPNNEKINIGTFIYYVENRIFYSSSDRFPKSFTDGIEGMTKRFIVKWNEDNN
jgi:hypothetical protein